MLASSIFLAATLALIPAGAATGSERETSVSPPTPDSRMDAEIISRRKERESKKAYWQDLVRHWRQKLALAEGRLRKAEEELGRARREYLITFLPVKAKEVRQWEEKLKVARRDRDEARRVLEEDLPRLARRAGVPPGWLRVKDKGTKGQRRKKDEGGRMKDEPKATEKRRKDE